MKIYDVIIIGGGIIGTSIAREMSRYRINTALLEKEEEPAFGVSKSNSGIIHPGTQNSPDLLKGKLCVRGNVMVRKVSRELGIDLKEVGELIVAFTEEERVKLTELKKDADTLGVPGTRIVDNVWLRENEPNLNKEALAALYAPTAGIISPYRYVYDLAENAVSNGVEMNVNTKVLDIIRNTNKKDKYRFEIVTSKGTFRAKHIINAAGLFADEIANMVGILDIKITPRKGEEFILDKKKEHLTRHLLFPLPSERSKGILVTRTSDGNPMIGPTAAEIEDKYDLSTSDKGFEEVIGLARKLVPSIKKSDIISYFAGLRPVCGDDFIIRYEDELPGFVNVAGIQSPGLTAAPAVAELVLGILRSKGFRPGRKVFFRKHRRRTVHLFDVSFKEARKLIEKDPAYGDIVCRCEMVSVKEIKDAIGRGAVTMDGIKFRTRAQAGRCHGSFCSCRLMKILAEETGKKVTDITKRGSGSEMVKGVKGE
ncbi:MAG: NAD(P)/FAD-dependent oxidoreductase [Candidatus Omnitrophica bacterium]|nr:NAD(P)/FAD-dependent oxidoreductase [Candidatus Omnitrophota bacterium]